MKKTYFFALAAIVLAGCSEDELSLPATDSDLSSDSGTGTDLRPDSGTSPSQSSDSGAKPGQGIGTPGTNDEPVSIQSGDVIKFDVVIRDFQQNHPDFENFSEEAFIHMQDISTFVAESSAMSTNGFGEDWILSSNYHFSCGNVATMVGDVIGQDGLPTTPNTSLPPYLQLASSSTPLKYGECTHSSMPGVYQHGYESMIPNSNGSSQVSDYVCPGKAMEWANPVYYTPGMVNSSLIFTMDANNNLDMHDGVSIVKANDLCDNQHFDQWYQDIPDVNLRTNTTIQISRDPATGYYALNSNYNNGGFFPLDSINNADNSWISQKFENQFGPQSLNIFCPPYEYMYAATQTDFLGNNTSMLCQSWLAYGGPKNVDAGNGLSAAVNAAADNSVLGLQHLRNYGFTIMAYAKFKYSSANQKAEPEFFNISGNDDIWVYVDGVLAIDLGGVHLPTPGSISIPVLAQNNHGCHAGEPLADLPNCNGASDEAGWADDTWHHIHIFYANRQTNGGDLNISTNISNFAANHY